MITPLNNNNIFIETIGRTYLYSDTADVTIGFNIEDIYKNLNQLKLCVKTLDKFCTKPCPYALEIETLQHRINQLNDLTLHLQLMTHNRNRRGFLNIIGAASKALFGTLDDDDLTIINHNIDKLFDDENRMKTIISNQTALIRKILKSEDVRKADENARQIKDAQQLLQRSEIATAAVLRAEESANSLRSQIDSIINAIIIGKQGIISPQLIDHHQFLDAYQSILKAGHIKPTIEAKESNFQFILDISELTLWTQERKVFFKISIPLLEDQEWTIQKIYPLPIKKGNAFIAPLVETPYYLLTADLFMNINKEYLDRSCRRAGHAQLCRRNQPIHSKLGTRDCATELINHSNQIKICQFVVFKITDLTFVPLHNENHYIVIPSKPTEVHALCEKDEQIKIDVPSLIHSKVSCNLVYNNNLMKIGGTASTIEYTSSWKEAPTHNNTDLEILLDKLESAPKVTNNFNNFQNTLNDLDQQMGQLQYERRLKDLKDYGLSTIQIMGYSALVLGTIYLLYRCKVFECIKSCVPSTLCINILCCKNTTEQRVEAAPMDLPPSAPPTLNEYEELLKSLPPIREDQVIVTPRRKIVRFNRTKRI